MGNRPEPTEVELTHYDESKDAEALMKLEGKVIPLYSTRIMDLYDEISIAHNASTSIPSGREGIFEKLTRCIKIL